MRIGDLAARTGVTTRALRYYEEQGLLSPARSASGQRHYPQSAASRVQLIQYLFAAGLPSRAIAVLLPTVDTRTMNDEVLGMLRAERERIDRQINALTESRALLDDVIHIATTPGACTD
ncbi:MerR family transcriptional regulator [Kineosporia sp. J2-2]|uniref:MerR family transcriptional regulator n=1 Tax=Kineosporia corallincola TaxID=2835133 RepID=A0ABS5TFT1_9ACTN|nr:MerR family transcriptional regulator [Kineosporia corallincola]